MNTTNNCSESKRELIPGMDMLIDHMKKQSLEIERLREENKELKESNEFIRKTCLMADEENTKLKEQIDELGELCENIDDNAYNSWKKITGNEDEAEPEEKEEEEEKEEVALDWMCYEFVRYDYNPEDGSVYDTDGTKIADWDDQGDGKMLWVDKKYKKKHNRLAKKSLANIVAMATAPVN